MNREVSDAVVIGSGPNGLAAAIRLAEAGRHVVVLEAADAPGGAVRTEELTLPGFHHDTYSAVYPASVASPPFARMRLEQHGLEWIHPDACSAQPLAGGEAVVLYRSLERTVASLNAQAPGDGDAWRTFVRPFLEHFPAVRDTMLHGFPPVRGPIRLAGRAGPDKLAQFMRLLLGSAVGLGDRIFAGGGSKAWLYGAATHGDAPPGRPGSAIAAFYLNLLGHAVGWPSPRGGAGRLADALVAHLEQLGGEVRTGARVERIMGSGGRVTGVGIAGGEELRAELVVADVLPGALVDMAGDALAGWYRAGLRAYKPGPATLKVDWALDGPIPWTNPEVRTSGTVHVGGGEQEMLASIGRKPGAAPFLLLGQQTIADPSRAPAGKHTAWAYTHGEPNTGWTGSVEAVEEQVERYAPGFRDRILARHVLGPAELEARNANLREGDVGAGSYVLRQAVFRPIPRWSPYRTPLRGLYLGSAATFPGGAVHGVPGDAAARAALRRA